MLDAKMRWKRSNPDLQVIKKLASELQMSTLLATLLVNRNITEIEQAQSFLQAELTDFHDPFIFTDMKKATERILHAIDHDEKIIIFGDYDADGVSSTAILMLTLERLGAKHYDYYIPNRFTEGYGPNLEAIEKLHAEGASCIITVDCGIAAIEVAAKAKALGIAYIITDHHQIGEQLPDAYAIIHTEKSAQYPCSELAGAGVAMKVVQALLGETPDELIAIAAIGTIADLVPLLNENRLIAKKGIAILKQCQLPGVIALANVAGVDQQTIDEETIGFALAPRINAAGRLEDANLAVELLLAKSIAGAASIAKKLNQLNMTRQQLVHEITEAAMIEIEEQYPLEQYSTIVLAQADWHIGVVGIVASRLVEKYHRPVVLLSIDMETGIAKGSARSIAGFNLFANLSLCKNLLIHFGGHALAAGLALSVDNLNALREKLCLLAKEQLSQEDIRPTVLIEDTLDLQAVSLPLAKELHLLAPFGSKNPKPILQIDNIHFAKIKKIGADNKHLKAALTNKADFLDAVGFGLANYAEQITIYDQAAVIGTLAINEWGNQLKPQFFIRDVVVDQMQIFDCRAQKLTEDRLSLILPSRKMIFFKQDGNKHLPHSYQKEAVWLDSIEKAKSLNLTNENIALIDLPADREMMDALFQGKRYSKLYLFFKNELPTFFQTNPSREQFKWFYAFIRKNYPFDYAQLGEKLEKHRGWSAGTVLFMSEVFFQLDFVTMENGIISVKPDPAKKDLSESVLYQQKQQQIELENQLLFSSAEQLRNYFLSFVE